MNSFQKTIFGLLLSLVVSTVSSAQDAAQDEKGFLGILYEKAEGENGIQVARIIEGSPAESKLLVNDVILKIGADDVTDPQQFRDKTQQGKPGDVVEFTVRRGEKNMTVEVKLGKRPAVIPELVGLERVTILAEELAVTGDLYARIKKQDAPFIILCHQAGWSRGEYREIAPKLNELGFNCLAIDQRSGGEVNDVLNLTNQRAIAENKETNFADAEPDMIEAVKWVRKKRPEAKIILWGSSYSAALALRIAGEHPDLVDGVMAFAPGEYFERFGKPKDWITNSAGKIEVPVFITSAKNEVSKWKGIFDAIPGSTKSSFIPETKGNHGSRALWEKFDDHEAYWKNVEAFLGQFK